MASLLRAISNYFREQKDQAAEALSDPIRDAGFDIEDSKKQVENFERKINKLLSDNITANKDKAKWDGEAEKWNRIAAQAAKANSRTDVQEAVQKKQNAESQARTLAGETAHNDVLLTKLRRQLETARGKIAHSESLKSQLAARMEGAKVRKELANGFKFDDGPLARLDKLERLVVEAESDAEAAEQLSTDPASELESKYSAVGTSVDDEVNRLMAGAGTAA